MTHAELVEKVARAISQHPVQKSWNFETARFDYDCTSAATAAIAAIHAALQEPSEGMMSAFWSMRFSNTKESFAACMQAMLDASPLKDGE